MTQTNMSCCDGNHTLYYTKRVGFESATTFFVEIYSNTIVFLISNSQHIYVYIYNTSPLYNINRHELEW